MKKINLTKGLSVLIALLVSFSVKAQDVIIKTDKKEIKAKILEIDENTVKYKKFEFLDGPSYNINKSEVFMIIYKNGTRETFETKPVEVKAAPVAIEPPKAYAPKVITEKEVAPVKSSEMVSERVNYFPGRIWGSLPTGGGVSIAAEKEFGLLPNFINAVSALSYTIIDNEYASSFSYGISIYASAYLPLNRLTGNVENQSKGFFPFVRVGPSFVSTDVEIDGSRTSASAFDIGYGVGADYRFSQKFGVSIVASQFNSFGAGLNFQF